MPPTTLDNWLKKATPDDTGLTRPPAAVRVSEHKDEVRSIVDEEEDVEGEGEGDVEGDEEEGEEEEEWLEEEEVEEKEVETEEPEEETDTVRDLDGNPDTRVTEHPSPVTLVPGHFFIFFIFFLAGVNFFEGKKK